MALINWNDKLSVQVDELDRQHQELVAKINVLTDAIRQGKGDKLVGEILHGLESYAATHFDTEEKYFKKFGYPDAEAHKKEHAEFIEKVSGFSKGKTRGELSLTIEVLQFLSDWLINHILKTDKAYVAFFRKKGLTTS